MNNNATKDAVIVTGTNAVSQPMTFDQAVEIVRQMEEVNCRIVGLKEAENIRNGIS